MSYVLHGICCPDGDIIFQTYNSYYYQHLLKLQNISLAIDNMSLNNLENLGFFYFDHKKNKLHE